MVHYFLVWLRAICLLLLAVCVILVLERICRADSSVPSVTPDIIRGCTVVRCDCSTPKCPCKKCPKPIVKTVIKEVVNDKIVFRDVFKKNEISLQVGRGPNGVSSHMITERDIGLQRDYGYYLGLRYSRRLNIDYSVSLDLNSNGSGSMGLGFSF